MRDGVAYFDAPTHEVCWLGALISMPYHGTVLACPRAMPPVMMGCLPPEVVFSSADAGLVGVTEINPSRGSVEGLKIDGSGPMSRGTRGCRYIRALLLVTCVDSRRQELCSVMNEGPTPSAEASLGAKERL